MIFRVPRALGFRVREASGLIGFRGVASGTLCDSWRQDAFLRKMTWFFAAFPRTPRV